MFPLYNKTGTLCCIRNILGLLGSLFHVPKVFNASLCPDVILSLTVLSVLDRNKYSEMNNSRDSLLPGVGSNLLGFVHGYSS